MAFSTQKDFFHVPFMNENVQFECQPACVQLKSYESTIDDRSWSRDETKRSKFLSDLVTCQFPARKTDGEGDEQRQPNAEITRIAKSTGGKSRTITPKAGTSVMQNIGRNTGGKTAEKIETNTRQANTSKRSAEQVAAEATTNIKVTKLGAFTDEDTMPQQLGDGILTAGDSLLQCANVHLADYQRMMNIKTSLEQQLHVSNEKLSTAHEEIQKIKEILDSKLDSNTTKDFYNKIQTFASAGKFSKDEKNEMLQIHAKMENMYKAYEALKAENTYLRRLIEKLSKRATITHIKPGPEKSTDVSYLQNEVNTLRKECTMLRSLEEEYHKMNKNTGKPQGGGLSHQDAENIKTIIEERDALRQKCKSFRDLEKSAIALEQKYKDAERRNSNMTDNLEAQESHIRDMECEMQKMQKYYEEMLEQARFKGQCLKVQLDDLKDEIVNYKCQAQKAEMLQTEVACLHNEVVKRDVALSDYNCQYRQLMDVVNELQAMKLQCVQDNHTQTCKNQTDDLAFFTCATLDEIMKEMKKKGCLKPEHDSEYFAYGLEPGQSDRDMTRLQHELEAIKKERDSMCADALKRIQELEDENLRLVEILKGGEEKMGNMLKKIEHLDAELNRNSEDLRRSNNEMSETKKLVEDISNIQLENQRLANAVGAINSRDDEKIIEDLRRQLEEEMAKLKKCHLEKLGLEKEAEERNNELKNLKELNNKLERENTNFKTIVDKHKSGERGEDDAIDKLKKGNSNNDHVDRNIKDHNNKLKDDKHNDNNNNDSIEDNKEVDGKGEERQQNIFGIKNPNNDFEKAHATDRHANSNDKSVQATALEVNSTFNEKPLQTIATNSSVIKKPIQAMALENDEAAALKDTPKTRPIDGKDFDAFIHKNADNLKITFNKGRCMEKGLRNILEDFIRERNFCLAHLANPKSKFYSICHKLCHSGLQALSFRELAYVHKKIFSQAEELLPGCLLDMILTEHKEEIQGMILPTTLEGMMSGEQQKCCRCKNELCCDKSEEILKEKVTKLEKDIEIARDYLESLKTLPLGNNSSLSDFGELMDANDCPTYRPASTTPNVSNKQLKKPSKSRLVKTPDIYH